MLKTTCVLFMLELSTEKATTRAHLRIAEVLVQLPERGEI